MESGAILSEDRKYRYILWRRWDSSCPWVAFIGLNPSTADEFEDDPTIRRCVGFAKQWGYGGLLMLNLFAVRSTDPKDMKRQENPIGPKNDGYLQQEGAKASKIICAWGALGGHLNRDQEVKRLFFEKYHLGLTKEGYPKHPLYLRKDVLPQIF